MKGSIEQSPVVVERAEDGGDKEKKKNKRRSGRRSKQNSPNPGNYKLWVFVFWEGLPIIVNFAIGF